VAGETVELRALAHLCALSLYARARFAVVGGVAAPGEEAPTGERCDAGAEDEVPESVAVLVDRRGGAGLAELAIASAGARCGADAAHSGREAHTCRALGARVTPGSDR
jgi:hypothetical protein